MALAEAGIILPPAYSWLLEQKEGQNWNNNVYDTTYALMGLASMNIPYPQGCDWLVVNYGKKWEHPGTTSLILSALIQQGKLFELKDAHHKFIREKAEWLNLKLQEGFDSNQLSTYNLAFQALLLADVQDEKKTISQWLLQVQNDNGSWGRDGGDIMATVNSLITLALIGI